MKIGMIGLGKLGGFLCFKEGAVSIYGLADPASGSVRYVGKTIFSPQQRLKTHLEEALRIRKTRVHRWLAKLHRKGLQPRILLLQLVPSDKWDSAEKDWITHFRERGNDLTNHTDGGDGVPGHRHDEETRRRIREARAKQVVRHSPETRAKMSRVAKGKPKSEKHRRSLSLALIGKPTGRHDSPSPEIREKIRKALMGRKRPEHSARMKGKPSSRKGVRLSEETKAKIREAALRQHAEGRGPNYNDPVRNQRISTAKRGKMSEPAKRGWITRRAK